MDPTVTVRRIEEREWLAFRALRLRSLKSDPLAFGSTLAKEAKYPDGKWQEWCRYGAISPEGATFVAVDRADALVGMVGSFTDTGRPHLWGLWVRPEHRRRSIGRQLMDAVLDWVDHAGPPRAVLLDVNPSRDGAVRLYEALGFAFSGIEQPLGHDPPAIARQMVRPTAGGR